MKIRYIYYVLPLLFSTIWLAEADYGVKNLKGTARVDLLSSDIYSTSLRIEVEDYMLLNLDNSSNKFKVFIDGGTSIMDLGSPDLPRLSTSIIIPDDMKMEVAITNVEYEDYLNVYIAPSKGNLKRDVDPSSVPFTYNDNYKKNDFYPGPLAQLDSPYILRDLRGQTVVFYPIQYNPATKTLRVYSRIDVDITSTNDITNDNILSRGSNSIKSNNEFMHIYNDLFINSNNDTRFEFLSDEGSMLIICYDDFIDEMQSLVDWKNKKGIHTEIVGINEVGSSPSSMQSYINDYYYENNLTYLLLVGDINQIPTHTVNGAASDPSFGFINGDDSFAEVIVGRFSANNPGELQTQIDRTLDYELGPEFVDHLDNALGIASNQGPGYGGLSDDAFNDLLWNDFLSSFTYDSFEGIYDGGGSVSQGINAINEGVGIINYTGHAGQTGWGNGAPLGVNDVNNLENAGKLPFIFTVGCNPGEFNTIGESFCEAWLRATDDEGNPTGAVGHLGSTISQSWEPPMHGQWAMNSILTESYEENISRSYGGIIVNGCMHMNEAQGSAGKNETNHWTIFGDPSLLIRTDQPETINVTYDQSIVVGQEEFIVDIGIDGALVAISSNNQLLSQAYSIGGVAILDISDASTQPGELDLVITSFNTYAYDGIVNVITPDGAYLIYNNYELVNDSNDLIEYGETIEMNLVIENVGVYNTNAINISISSDDEYVTILDDNSMIAYAISGETAVTENTLSFMVANNVPDLHNISFNGLLNDGDNEWEISFNLQAHAPVFEVLNPVFIDADENNVWDPGETATINVDLVNSGSVGYGWYPGAIITTENPYINILSSDSENTFYGIGGNTTYQGSFMVEAIESTPLNTEVEFIISWGYSTTAPCESDDCIEQANFSYSVIIGHPSILIWDPSSEHTSGDALIDYFETNGFNGYDYITSTDIPDLESYMTAFIFLGIYPNNFVLGELSAAGFIDMLSSGKNIYLEGGDTWAFDIQTSLHSMFGLEGASDGTADLGSIVGSVDSFAEGYFFDYDGGNNYIDQLSLSGGFALLENDAADYITAVAYENMPMGYKTIGASHELGGLQGDNFDDYIDGILDFFNEADNNPDPECSAGDLNNDGTTDVTDIIRTVNIIINSGFPPTDEEICAGDVNADGSINVLDVLIIVNLILDA